MTSLELTHIEWTAVVIKFSRDHKVSGEHARAAMCEHHGIQDVIAKSDKRSYHLQFCDETHKAVFMMEFHSEMKNTSRWRLDMANTLVSMNPHDVNDLFGVTKNYYKGEE